MGKITKLVQLETHDDIYSVAFDDGVHGDIALQSYLSPRLYTKIQEIGFDKGVIGDGGMCIKYNDELDFDAFAMHIYLTGINPFLDRKY